MRITDYPDLLRTKGKEPMPQAWDETNQDWTPAIDSAATLKALREALGAPADATQADPVQEATAIALLKGLLELTANRATDQTLEQIKTALTDGTQQVQLTGSLTQQVTVAARAVRTSAFNSALYTVPERAKGLHAVLRVYGITGTFSAGQGVYLSLQHRVAGALTRTLRGIKTKVQSDSVVHTVLHYPGIQGNIDVAQSTWQTVTGPNAVIPLPCTEGYALNIDISGTFGADQGVDCDLVLTWMF